LAAFLAGCLGLPVGVILNRVFNETVAPNLPAYGEAELPNGCKGAYVLVVPRNVMTPFCQIDRAGNRQRRRKANQQMVTIEDTQRKHIRPLHEVLERVAKEKMYLAWTEAPPFASFKAFVTNNSIRRCPQLVAVDGDRVVGWCDITIMQRQATKHCGVLGMGVLKEYRNKGIGTRLLAAALEKARTYGLFRIELEVFEDNVRAIRLYERIGFKIEGKKIAAVMIDQKSINVLILALLLRESGTEGEGGKKELQ
jgi:ribosomal protein S18 acetylase RimI-like enzyme